MRERSERLAVANSIAEAQRFQHWELEFADIFEENGGFDLMIGNPPWLKMTWTEDGILSEKNPIFAVKKLSASDIAKERTEALNNSKTYEMYMNEYESMSGIQNFLNAVENYEALEGLQENINDDAESREFYCEVIVDEADKMNKMVKKLLSLNQLEFGNDQVHFEHFDLRSVIQSIVNSSDILFRQKEVTLSYHPDEEPIMVWADEYMIEEVVSNYVSNALNHVKYENKIEIKTIRKGDRVCTSVFNTGDPIPEEDMDKIWSKFYKVDKARTREYGGNGIGLSIVKAVMDAHNQKFGVKNYDNGVEFWFELDVKSVD